MARLLVTRLRIFDDQRRPVHGIADLSTEHVHRQSPPGLFTAGPLVPGTYTIEADLADGSRHRQSVRVEGTAPCRVTLGQ